MRLIAASGTMMTKTNLIRLGVFILLLAGMGLAVSYRDQFDAAALQAWVKTAGVWAPLLFMLVYAIAAVLFLPGTVFTLAGGALFGPVWGAFYNLTGATLGAALAFLVSRYLASDWMLKRSGRRLKRVINGVEGEGWRFVAFVRLVPVFPFNLLNYVLGLTRIPFGHYVLASYFGMLPAAIAYTYLGYAGREAVAGGEGLIQKGLLALALLAVAAFLPRLLAHLRRGAMLGIDELKQRLDSGEDILLLDVRSAQDFVGEQGHIPAATNIPLEQLAERVDEIADYEEKPVVALCRTDRRSAQAAELLARNGFADVHVVRNGMTAGNEKGYPLVEGV